MTPNVFYGIGKNGELINPDMRGVVRVPPKLVPGDLVAIVSTT